MDDIKLNNEIQQYFEKEIIDYSSKEATEQIVQIYKNFSEKRNVISQKIDSFINTYYLKREINIHTSKINASARDFDLNFYIDGYKLIHEIRKELDLEEIQYQIGIYDEITGELYEVILQEEEFLEYVASRGNSKIALQHSYERVESLMKKASEQNDVTTHFNNLIKILKNKQPYINYGYAFEAYGHLKKLNIDIKNKNDRHDIYYQYYRNVLRNNIPWTAGGDIEDLQYKLIRIYVDQKGSRSISSASVTSKNTIIDTLKKIQEMLNSLESQDNSIPVTSLIKITKTFTKVRFPKNISKKIQQNIEERIKEALELK